MHQFPTRACYHHAQNAPSRQLQHAACIWRGCVPASQRCPPPPPLCCPLTVGPLCPAPPCCPLDPPRSHCLHILRTLLSACAACAPMQHADCAPQVLRPGAAVWGAPAGGLQRSKKVAGRVTSAGWLLGSMMCQRPVLHNAAAVEFIFCSCAQQPICALLASALKTCPARTASVNKLCFLASAVLDLWLLLTVWVLVTQNALTSQLLNGCQCRTACCYACDLVNCGTHFLHAGFWWRSAHPQLLHPTAA